MKKLLLFAALFWAVFSFSALVYANDDINVQTLPVPDSDEFSVTGDMPFIALDATEGVSDILREAFENEVNLKIENIINGKLEDGINSRARGMAFSYVCETDGDIVSTVIYTSISLPGHTRVEADSVNFDKSNLRFADINAVLGSNGIKLINSYLNSLILTDLTKYNPGFAGLTEKHAFYLKDGSLYLVFNAYELTKGSPETETVVVPTDIVKNYVAEISEEVTPFQSFATFLPLRDICEYFGFNVTWQGLGMPIEISRETFRTEITMNQNSYKKGLLELKLESPPLLINGTAFVPITFFEEILGLSYYVSDTSVTVSELTQDYTPETSD